MTIRVLHRKARLMMQHFDHTAAIGNAKVTHRQDSGRVEAMPTR